MTQLQILVVDDDDMLALEIEALAHPAMRFSMLSASQLPASQLSGSSGSLADYDVIIAGVDTAGGLDLVADLCSRPGMPPVIALAGRGAHHKSLEHVLLLAELRGAALSLPKPIDGIELALAAIELVRARSGSTEMAIVAKDLERRLDW